MRDMLFTTAHREFARLASRIGNRSKGVIAHVNEFQGQAPVATQIVGRFSHTAAAAQEFVLTFTRRFDAEGRFDVIFADEHGRVLAEFPHDSNRGIALTKESVDGLREFIRGLESHILAVLNEDMRRCSQA